MQRMPKSGQVSNQVVGSEHRPLRSIIYGRALRRRQLAADGRRGVLQNVIELVGRRRINAISRRVAEAAR